MLEEEQEKRQHLEQVSEELQTERLEQQRLLEKERKRLEQLEKDRKSADEQLQVNVVGVFTGGIGCFRYVLVTIAWVLSSRQVTPFFCCH